MEVLAHSGRPKQGITPQRYADHISNVVRHANKNAKEAARYSLDQGTQLIQAVRVAAEFHDLGKLDEANQAVLASGSGKDSLRLNHVDAGVAHVFGTSINNLLAATLVYAHHIGLPDFQDQRNNKPGYVLRDTSIGPAGRSTKELIDENLADYLKLHGVLVQKGHEHGSRDIPPKPPPLLFRIALSCLVDADHHDTARHYEQATSCEGADLLPADRLELLDAYIRTLAKSKEGERTALRNEVYEACRNADPGPSMYACDSPVGTGKTTAVMAHLLRIAAEKDLRRIFVVLPFTNIIDQSVDVYRAALAIEGERPEDVVVAHHHRAEFEDIGSRQLSFLWEAPIVVTTAVQFFETIASNRPAALRKLHQLPGSAIFIDEAHAALPPHLWPQSWQWLKELESRWSCHFVLGSGSLSRFWEMAEFSDPPVTVPELVSPDVNRGVFTYEKTRVLYQPRSDLLTLTDLLEWLAILAGPRLLIVNTVQSAAVIAATIAEKSDRLCVEHLSTSLCPRDRKITLDRVKERLADKNDSDWTLVATSCVESGVDLSFRTGLRERCSLNSLIQIGGRVNRKGEYAKAEVWDFQLRHEGLIKKHPRFDTSQRVLGQLFEQNRIGPEWTTEAMRREIRWDGMKIIVNEILRAERNYQFREVADKFTVIDSCTVTAVVDRDLVHRLTNREKIDRNLMQALSVQIWGYQREKWALEQIDGFRGLYSWGLAYDCFLGYMAGVLQLEKHEQEGGSTV